MADSVCWQLTTDDQPTPSIVLGTVHLSIEQVMRRWVGIQRLIDKYDHVYTESSLDHSDQVYQQQFIHLPQGVRHDQYIGERRWLKMSETFRHYYSIDIRQMARLRPLFIMTAIQQVIVGQTQGKSLDLAIWDYAVANDKSVSGIESAQEQIEILLQIPLHIQYRQLVKLSKRVQGQQAKINKLIDAYVEQDVHKMYQLSKRSMGYSRSLLLHDRNAVMADRILSWHQEEARFYSFGAGHLGGDSGVLNLLKRAGARLQPVYI